MKRQFYVTVYAAESAAYKNGQKLPIYCNHTFLGLYGLNTVGEITALPGASQQELTSSPPVSVVVPAGGIPANTIFPDPAQFVDSGFKAVAKIKDEVTLKIYYADAADYAANVVRCNPLSASATCNSPYGQEVISVGATSATISFTVPSGAAGYEYLNNTSLIPPTTTGTVGVGVGTETVNLTGLTPSTTYRLWNRTICADGSKSGWTSQIYTTSPS